MKEEKKRMLLRKLSFRPTVEELKEKKVRNLKLVIKLKKEHYTVSVISLLFRKILNLWFKYFISLLKMFGYFDTLMNVYNFVAANEPNNTRFSQQAY